MKRTFFLMCLRERLSGEGRPRVPAGTHEYKEDTKKPQDDSARPVPTIVQESYRGLRSGSTPIRGSGNRTIHIIHVDTVGSHPTEQNDWSLVATQKVGGQEESIGRLDVSEFDGKVYVNMIEVEDGYLRQGIASALMGELEKYWPKNLIVTGLSTKSGTSMLRSMGYKIESVSSPKPPGRAWVTTSGEIVWVDGNYKCSSSSPHDCHIESHLDFYRSHGIDVDALYSNRFFDLEDAKKADPLEYGWVHITNDTTRGGWAAHAFRWTSRTKSGLWEWSTKVMKMGRSPREEVYLFEGHSHISILKTTLDGLKSGSFLESKSDL